jgi:hypothetical protein
MLLTNKFLYLLSIDYRSYLFGIFLAQEDNETMSEKGKPFERVGRKATGLSFTIYKIRQQGCQAQHPHAVAGV